MADKFDPYREALVMEIETVWPAECRDWTPDKRADFEHRLHATASHATKLQYIRTHTGFCRRIVVTPDDLARLASTNVDAPSR